MDDAERSDLDFAYLTTTGRISGAPHRIEIWFAIEGNTVYLMAGDRDRSDWIRNIMGSPDVVLEIGDRKRTTRAQIVSVGTDDDATARRLLVEKYASRDADDLTDWGKKSLPVAIAWPA